MGKKIIHVNMHNIRYNTKNNNKRPVLTIKDKGATRYASEVTIDGPSKLVYKPDNPLSCGARVWIETDADITLIDEMTYAETLLINDD